MAYGNPNLLPVDGSTFEGNAHAFTAGSNTTLSMNSGGALEGTYSVRLTPTAAGSVTATSPRFNVTAGTEYVAQVPVRNSAATAGKTATATITWYDAVSGGSSLGTTSGAAAMNNSVGWWTANYPVAIGEAPAGALSATVTVSVSNLAAGEYINIDRVYAGVPVTRANNLLDFNVASIEKDPSGWLADNGTTSRVVGFLAADTGYYSLGVTSTAAGDMPIRTSALYAVTPGTTYVSYLVNQSPSASLTVFYELRWYDAADVQVGVEQRTLSADNTLHREAISGVAPAGAAKCKIWVRPQATAAGQIFAIDDVSLTVAPNEPGNLLTYEEFSTESTLPAWTLVGGTGLSRVNLTSGITDGYFALSYTPVDESIHKLSLDRLVPVTPGSTYAVGATYFGHNTSAETTTMTYRVHVDWYDSSGILFQAGNPDGFYSRDIAPGVIGGSSSTETRTCPEGAAFARVVIELDHSASLVTAYYVDNVFLKEATPEYTLVTDNETGSIVYTINSVPSHGLTGTISVYRVHQDGTMVPVRGYGYEYNRAPYTQSPVVIEDYEAPLGETVWYKTEWFSTAGARNLRVYTQSVPTPVLDDPDYVWFKSPGIPALNTQVMMEAPLSWQRVSRSAKYDVVGRKNPVHVTNVRAGRTGSITILIWDPSANELFNSLLDSGLPALIQAMPGYGIDGNLYLSIGDVEVEPLDPDAREDGWRWTLALTEIDRPEGGIQGSAGLTWQDILDNPAYTAWEDIFDSHDTWADVLTKG